MFSPDSKLMQIISRITDLILLNILFIITCLPVITIGPSLAALYTLCFQLMREEYSGITKAYFRAFKNNFKQATVLWLLLLIVILPALYYFLIIFRMESLLRYSSILFLLISLAGLMTGSYLFPWISQFENTISQSLQNALILSISRLPRTAAILVINLMPVIMLFFRPETFLQISFLWVSLYFAAAAYMNTGLLWHVFKPYRNP